MTVQVYTNSEIWRIVFSTNHAIVNEFSTLNELAVADNVRTRRPADCLNVTLAKLKNHKNVKKSVFT